MTSPLNRNEVIELLKSLGSERDEEALEAARQLHERITAAGLTWEDLLEPDDDDFDDDDDSEEPDDDTEDGDPEDEAPDSPEERAGKNAESLALIDKLLARPGISDDFRQELEDYKADIAEGDFEAADHSYVQALYKRLSKQG
jgi:hypothetical protein